MNTESLFDVWQDSIMGERIVSVSGIINTLIDVNSNSKRNYEYVQIELENNFVLTVTGVVETDELECGYSMVSNRSSNIINVAELEHYIGERLVWIWTARNINKYNDLVSFGINDIMPSFLFVGLAGGLEILLIREA